LHYQGGSPVLTFILVLGHPEVYIVLLPALVTSEVIATNARKPIFGYRAMIMSIIAIGFINYSLGTSYVRFRDESVPWFSIYFYYFVDCNPSAKSF
jgi:heme/copper-type cytochrome/quinol oxidase subunit 1